VPEQLHRQAYGCLQLLSRRIACVHFVEILRKFRGTAALQQRLD